MIQTKLQSADQISWTDLPLHTLLFEWFTTNINMPTDFGSVVAYMGLFIITWYAIVWMVRMIMTIIWPLFLIGAALLVFRLLQNYEPQEITAFATKAVTVITDTLLAVMGKTLDFLANYFY